MRSDARNALRTTHNNTTRQANMQAVDAQIDLDALIDYTIINHKTDLIYDCTTKEDRGEKDDLLTFMSGVPKSDAADICDVLAAKQAPDKNNNLKANEFNSSPCPTI